MRWLGLHVYAICDVDDRSQHDRTSGNTFYFLVASVDIRESMTLRIFSVSAFAACRC